MSKFDSKTKINKLVARSLNKKKKRKSSKIHTSPITRSPFTVFYLVRIVIRATRKGAELVRAIKLSRALIRGYAWSVIIEARERKDTRR